MRAVFTRTSDTEKAYKSTRELSLHDLSYHPLVDVLSLVRCHYTISLATLVPFNATALSLPTQQR